MLTPKNREFFESKLELRSLRINLLTIYLIENEVKRFASLNDFASALQYSLSHATLNSDRVPVYSGFIPFDSDRSRLMDVVGR